MRAILLTIALLVAAAPLAAAYPDPDKVPTYYDSVCFEQYDKRFVHDYLGMLQSVYGGELEGAACEVYGATSAHYVVVTVPDTEGEPLENYALHLFETWAIGDADRLDGMMLLYVDDYLQSGQSALRIEVGYGLEGVIASPVTSDAWDIMLDARDRALDAGETPRDARASAMIAGSAFLLGKLKDGHTEAGFPSPTPQSDAPPFLFWVAVVVVVILVLYLLSRSSRGHRGWGYYPSSPAWSSRGSSIWVPPSGGFGGGGSFGGGRSGGGGRGGRF